MPAHEASPACAERRGLRASFWRRSYPVVQVTVQQGQSHADLHQKLDPSLRMSPREPGGTPPRPRWQGWCWCLGFAGQWIRGFSHLHYGTPILGSPAGLSPWRFGVMPGSNWAPPTRVEARSLHRMTAPVMRYLVTRHRVRAWDPPRPIMSASLGRRAPGDRAFVSANSQGVAKLGQRGRRTRANGRKLRSHTLPFTGRSPWHLWNVRSRYQRGCQSWRGKVLIVPPMGLALAPPIGAA